MKTATKLALPIAAIILAFLLGAGGAQAQVPPDYFPFGPQVDVPVGDLGDGWNLCYASNYNDDGDDIDDILAQCDGEFLLLAGKPVGMPHLLRRARGALPEVDAGPHRDVGLRLREVQSVQLPGDADGVGAVGRPRRAGDLPFRQQSGR